MHTIAAGKNRVHATKKFVCSPQKGSNVKVTEDGFSTHRLNKNVCNGGERQIVFLVF